MEPRRHEGDMNNRVRTVDRQPPPPSFGTRCGRQPGTPYTVLHIVYIVLPPHCAYASFPKLHFLQNPLLETRSSTVGTQTPHRTEIGKSRPAREIGSLPNHGETSGPCVLHVLWATERTPRPQHGNGNEVSEHPMMTYWKQGQELEGVAPMVPGLHINAWPANVSFSHIPHQQGYCVLCWGQV
jgi:hypothetical protein